jgi:nucleotidyltransferase/DNA polymerase involved in DNA repair
MDGLFHIDWTWTLTAQERKDFRRVQKSRNVWKKRAVSRGEDRRRLRERRKEVDCSREAWRARALDAEHRSRQIEIENHQLKSALAQVPQPTSIDNTHFF